MQYGFVSLTLFIKFAIKCHIVETCTRALLLAVHALCTRRIGIGAMKEMENRSMVPYPPST